jgi:large subunit ribosomal protein L25
MANVRDMKATARAEAGKGAARAERRAGRVPGVIYGDNQPPVTISLDHAELRQRIYAGHFLTTIYDLEVDGAKQRVIPRDYQLDSVKDFPIHVDFMRLGEGATIRVNIPIHVLNAEAAPGVKRGGAVNIVTHAVEVDVSGLDMNHSIHLSDIELPANVRPLTARDVTLVTIVAPSGYLEEQKAAAEAAAAAATAAAAAPEGGAPATGAPSAPGAAPAAPAGGGDAAKKS